MSQSAVDGVDYAQLFHQAPVGFIVASTQGTILAANATMCGWTGVQPGTLEGSRLLDILPVGDRLMYRTHAEPQLERDGHLAELSLQLSGPDGVRLPVLLSVTRTMHGTVHRDLMVFFSAPERRRYERELATAHRRLEDAEAERTLLLDEARHRSLHDPLTGLPNRLHLQDSLLAALAHAGEQRTRVGLLFCDVNSFKQVNDTLGHAVGDEVLQHIANRLVAAVRSEDIVARISGDEFVVLIPDFDHPEELDSIAGRVRDSVASEITLGGTDLRLSISVGRAETAVAADADQADHQELANTLLITADKDMYRAKTALRGTPHPA